MELLILKDGQIVSRIGSMPDGEYTLMAVTQLPSKPTEGVGEYAELTVVDGEPTYVMHSRPLTVEERLTLAEAEIDKTKYAWKAGEAVTVGDRRYYVSGWYRCLQSHTTQSDWTPDITPALWEAE